MVSLASLGNNSAAQYGAAKGAGGMSGWAAAAMAAEKAFDTGMSIWSANRANSQARSNIRMQDEMQKHNYRHRYQWTMEDMQKAGLNPILAYSQGVGGGVGGVGAAPTARVEASSARGSVRENLEYKMANEQLKLLEKEGYLKDAVTNRELAQRNNLWQQTENLKWFGESAKAQATSDKLQEELYKNYPELRKWETIIKSLSPFIGKGGTSARTAR